MNNQPDDLEDEQWLSALSGKVDPNADPVIQAQAIVLRQAMQARNAKIQSQIPAADAALYEQTLFRLRREGLVKKHSLWDRPQLWGLAATIALGIAVTAQIQPFADRGGDDVLRGGSTVLIVSDVDVRLAELLDLLKTTGAEPKVERTKDGRVVLRVRATQDVLDALSEQRIEPKVTDGMATMVLQPTPGGKK
jgi:hypothetical protein